MNRSAVFPLAVVAALVASAPSAFAQGNVRKEVDAFYARSKRLVEAKDIAGLAKMMTPDAVQTGAGVPPMNRDAWMAQMKQVYPTLSALKVRYEILSVKPGAGNVVVQLRQSLDAQQAGPDGKKHKIEVSETARDTLVKSGGGWLLKRSETLKQTVKIDGKVPPPPPSTPKKP